MAIYISLCVPRLLYRVVHHQRNAGISPARREQQEQPFKKGIFNMSLIRYQVPELTAWPSLDRWSNLRDDLNSLFEAPFWAGFGRMGQLFTEWSPALDLYQ